LFISDDGAPNTSIYVLVAMSILKEGHEWSDEQILPSCQASVMDLYQVGVDKLHEDSKTSNATMSRIA